MPHTPTDMSKWWTRSSCKLCQKLVISLFQSEISDVPAGCVCDLDPLLIMSAISNAYKPATCMQDLLNKSFTEGRIHKETVVLYNYTILTVFRGDVSPLLNRKSAEIVL